MKRLVDLLLAVPALVLLAPVFLVLSAAVVLTSGFPIFFRQQRVGRAGRDFALVKFRSMSNLAGAEKGTFDAGNTRRVTPVGRFLRRTKLDEIPQLWNVIAGDMSLVGPRPEVRRWVDAYPERWAVVHRVRPGVTDPASLLFRREEEILAASPDPEATYRNDILPRKLALYEQYVHTRSLAGDLRILAQTAVALLTPFGKPHASR